MQDIRRALEDRNLDAISIATPNHWHALMTIWACQAGKDVYVEKPCSHNVHEGRIAVETARKHNRIVQHGTQSRSERQLGQRRSRSSSSGKLRQAAGVARPVLQAARQHRHQAEHRRRPTELDFNLWLGPAQQQPFHANLVHYNWHWFWDFGNGDIGNQGVHEMDIARWAIPGATLPRSVVSLGGRFGYNDQGETPNTQIAVIDYGDTQLIFEVRGLPHRRLSAARASATSSTSRKASSPAHASIRSGGNAAEPLPAASKRRPARPRRRRPLRATSSPPSAAAASTTSTPTSSKATTPVPCATWPTSPTASATTLPFNPRTRAFGDNQDATETLDTHGSHLSGAPHNLRLADMQLTVGRRLEIDARTETLHRQRRREPAADAQVSRSRSSCPIASAEHEVALECA